jgi:hypothetical protein
MTLAAREQAITAYLAYRRDGGAPEFDAEQLAKMVQLDPNDPELPYHVVAEVRLIFERAGPGDNQPAAAP